MAQGWYPVISEELCINCNQCVDFCTHGVYKTGPDRPSVEGPDNCVEFCRGCSKICPVEAISYFGDFD